MKCRQYTLSGEHHDGMLLLLTYPINGLDEWNSILDIQVTAHNSDKLIS